MSDKMVALAVFTNPIEAELTKQRLQNEGIQVHLLGDTGGSPFAGVGGLFGHMTLMVSPGDVQRAGRLLGEEEPEAVAEAESEGSTAIQTPEWACGEDADADDPESQYRAAAREFQPQTRLKKEGIGAGVSDTPAEKEESTDTRGADREDVTVIWTPDRVAFRAWLSTVIGLMLFAFALVSIGMHDPLALNPVSQHVYFLSTVGELFALLSLGLIVYSMALLISLLSMSEKISVRGMWRMGGALVINAVVLGTVGLLLLSMAR